MTTARATTGSAAKAAGTGTAGGQIRVSLLTTTVLALALTLVGALLAGSPGAAGAAIGCGTVLVFFALGALTVNAVASVSPSASVLVALLTYVLQVVLVALVLVALDRSGLLEDAVDRGWAAGSIIAATTVWLGTHTISTMRSRQPLYDLPERDPGAVSDGEEASAR